MIKTVGLDQVGSDDLSEVAKALDDFRLSLMFSEELSDSAFGVFSVQDYLLGLNALEQAKCHFAKAAVVRAAELSGRL